MHPSVDYDLDDSIEHARERLLRARSVTVLTGAGISAESGVPTFRASDGLWEGYRIEDVATPEGFERDPRLVWRFYNERRMNVARVHPNPGHDTLARMEQHWGDAFTLVTQNVDGLHRKAGSQRVLEIHGSLSRTRCTECGVIADRGLEPLGDLPACPECQALLRPDIVWFHEMLPEKIWEQAEAAALRCDVFLVIGTSAVVHPAAGLIPLAKYRHRFGHAEIDDCNPATIIEINLTRTEASRLADIGLYAPSGQILPRLWP